VDASYLGWLDGQTWFRDKFIELHQTIINYNAEPAETPEHNALQVKFLDDDYCVRFAKAAGVTGLQTFESGRLTEVERVTDYIAAEEKKIAELQAKLNQNPDGYFKKYWSDEINDREKNSAGWQRRLGLIRTAKPLVYICDREFEMAGVDVTFTFGIMPDSLDLKTHYALYETWKFRIEIKPAIGDDYPAVLRQMRSSKANKLLVSEFNAAGATRGDFVATFKTAGITVVFADRVETT